MAEIMLVLIVSLSLVNLARMAGYMISSDVHAIRHARRRSQKKRWHLPSITVVIPAYNEEKSILKAVASVVESDYPAGKLTVVVADDGSTDRTAEVVRSYTATLTTGPRVRLVSRPNRGKAAAINHALKYYAKSQLAMCLDSDSYLDKMAIRNSAQHFRDRNVIASSSNINILDDGTLFSLIQRFEYLVGYQMKRGQALMNIEYIVGGIGSTFRMSELKKVGYYDTNTMTEDIDLTMKLLLNKRRRQRIAYAHDSIAYTEAAHSFKELSVQRFRWKYGRSQTFVKHSQLFFSRDRQHAKRLSWFILPQALIQDLVFFIEPLVIGWFLYITLYFGNPYVFATALVVLTSYVLINVWSSSQLGFWERMRLSYYAPAMYFCMFVLSFAEYYALIKSLTMSPGLRHSMQTKHVTWVSPGRRGNEA